MSLLETLRDRFAAALARLAPAEDLPALLDMIRSAQNAQFGDYQANCALVLGNKNKRPPREIAQELVAAVELDDLCETPEIAGPGFVNLRMKREALAHRLSAMQGDERLGVEPVVQPKTVVIDYSSPNVAKPMHVGHIRSTVIGDALARMLRFQGHQVVTDNHLGDWGTQFGMILYGWKHFRDDAAYAQQPVQELSRLYKLVSKLVSFREAVDRELPEKEREVARRQEALGVSTGEAERLTDEKEKKKAQKNVDKVKRQLEEAIADRDDVARKIAEVESEAKLATLAAEHPRIDQAVLEETSKLHEGDAENLALWHQFLPHCRDEIRRVYDRLGVAFDYEYGESFYHDRLAGVVESLSEKGLARPSQGATCVFLDDFETPMIVRKQDGAFLYATTDLATIAFREETWRPDEILYVVDHRQSEHFDKLFAVAKAWGYDRPRYVHVKFGTVLGKDGKPYKTRSGTAEGLEGLLDEAVERAYAVVKENDDAKPNGPELFEDERRQVAWTVGHAAVKYADLSHNRTSDYVYDADKMVAFQGNTATYLQYSYARVASIFRRGGISLESVAASKPDLAQLAPEERPLALELLRFDEAIASATAEYYPNLLVNYLYVLAQAFARFYDECPILRSDVDPLDRERRLVLALLTARTLKKGLDLLGIQVVERM
ncbi:MAG TPA: arginine--tRNA ligase [Pirellulaceae bacterium]|jgi:arginyl-tRNA synthetase|nr:arginine--tRNA ligase [Pirellulaceae bacterium]